MFRRKYTVSVIVTALFAAGAASVSYGRDTNYEKAVNAYKRAAPKQVFKLLSKPQTADDYQLRGMTHRKALFGTGRAEFESAVRLAGGKPSYTAQLALAMMQEKRTRDAGFLLKNAMAKDKANTELRSTYGLCLAKLGQSETGFALLKESVEKMPTSILCLENIALGYYESFDSHQADIYYSKLVQLQPDNVWPLLDRAALYEESGNKKSALRDFNSALQISPISQTVFWKRAVFFLKNKQYKEALADCKSCLNGEENVIAIRRRCLRAKVDAAERLGLYAEAARDLDELNQVSIDAPKLSWGMRNDLLRQAALFERSCNYSKALETIRILEKYYPSKTEVLLIKARILGKNKNFEQSLALCNYLIAKDDSISEWHSMRAFALRGLGRTKEAEKEETIARSKPDTGKMPDMFENRIKN